MENKEKAANFQPAANILLEKNNNTIPSTSQALCKENSIPDSMKDFSNWILRRDKIPYSIKDNKCVMCSVTDSSNFMTFNEAINNAKKFDCTGVGFVFDGFNFVGIDIDHCIDDNGNLNETAQSLVSTFKDTYIEYSQSGKGIHIIYWENRPKGLVGRRSKDVEVYNYGRYFAITGNRVPNTGNNFNAYTDITQKIIEQYIGNKNINDIQKKYLQSNNTSPFLSDDVLLSIINKSNDSELKNLLYEGDISKYGNDDSRADIILMLKLAFWTNGNPSQMLSIFGKSKLAQRDKWQNRPDYQQRTLDSAFMLWDENGFQADPQSNKNNIENISEYEEDNSNIPESEKLRRILNDIKKNAPIHLSEKNIFKLLHSDFTDFNTAEVFVNTYGQFIKFNHNTGCWFLWQGTHWQEVPDKSSRLLYEKWFSISRWAIIQAKFNYHLLKEQLQQNKRIWGKDKIEEVQEKLKMLYKIVKSTITLESHHKLKNTIEVASGLRQVSSFDKDFNSDIFKFNTKNAVFSLNKGTCNHEHNPDDLITLLANVKYNPNAKCPAWDDFLRSAIPDENTRRYLQKVVGYCLTGSTKEEKFFFLYGQGGTGKSTFVETIADILGDYAKSFPIELLTKNSRDKTGDEASPQLYDLRHCRLVFASETEKGRKFDEMKLKNWTGSDTLIARDLYKPPIKFKPRFKVIFTGNYMPAIEDITDEGLKRRLVIIPFKHKPQNIDTNLKESFLKEENRSAIFNWVLEGCKMYLKEGLGELPANVQSALTDYYEANDNIAPFFSDTGYIFEQKLSIPAKNVWDTYIKWCNNNNERPIKRTDLVEMILRRFKDKNITISKRSANKTRDIFKGFGIGKPTNQSS